MWGLQAGRILSFKGALIIRKLEMVLNSNKKKSIAHPLPPFQLSMPVLHWWHHVLHSHDRGRQWLASAVSHYTCKHHRSGQWLDAASCEWCTIHVLWGTARVIGYSKAGCYGRPSWPPHSNLSVSIDSSKLNRHKTEGKMLLGRGHPFLIPASACHIQNVLQIHLGG